MMGLASFHVWSDPGHKPWSLRAGPEWGRRCPCPLSPGVVGDETVSSLHCFSFLPSTRGSVPCGDLVSPSQEYWMCCEWDDHLAVGVQLSLLDLIKRNVHQPNVLNWSWSSPWARPWQDQYAFRCMWESCIILFGVSFKLYIGEGSVSMCVWMLRRQVCWHFSLWESLCEPCGAVHREGCVPVGAWPHLGKSGHAIPAHIHW